MSASSSVVHSVLNYWINRFYESRVLIGTLKKESESEGQESVMKFPSCSHWNKISVNKIFGELKHPEPKIKAFILMYEPLQVSNREKGGKS